VEGHGDPSNNIRIGQIVRTRGHEVAVNEDAPTAAARAFHIWERLQNASANAVSRGAFVREDYTMPILND
jgi:hypothetical protein